jgi:hypothetical protein
MAATRQRQIMGIAINQYIKGKSYLREKPVWLHPAF